MYVTIVGCEVPSQMGWASKKFVPDPPDDEKKGPNYKKKNQTKRGGHVNENEQTPCLGAYWGNYLVQGGGGTVQLPFHLRRATTGSLGGLGCEKNTFANSGNTDWGKKIKKGQKAPTKVKGVTVGTMLKKLEAGKNPPIWGLDTQWRGNYLRGGF